jgi:hypothetical protein
VVHHESVSGPERWSKVGENIMRLIERWGANVVPDILVTPEGVMVDHPRRAL